MLYEIGSILSCLYQMDFCLFTMIYWINFRYYQQEEVKPNPFHLPFLKVDEESNCLIPFFKLNGKITKSRGLRKSLLLLAEKAPIYSASKFYIQDPLAKFNLVSSGLIKS